MAFILGAVIGSFINVVILRLPEGESVVYPASHCPHCREPLRWWHNIPIISWLLLRGRCFYCSSPISIQYPIVELLTGLLFASISLKGGLSLQSLVVALVFTLLLALSLIDLRFKAVPDSLNLLALTLSLFSRPNIVEALRDALIMAGAFALLRFYVSYYVSKREELWVRRRIEEAPWLRDYYPKHIMVEAMGEGDIMVAGTIGAVVGIQLAIVAIFLAALLALPASLYNRFAKRELELPFIPFLSLGFYLSYLFGDQLLESIGLV
ncbi:MAG: prepilin peptidase [Epsilonproteobacteria bacterium]|nr:prepilin peptidase [Campylobacterota bacterium]NPA57298.1 prepilin peptidase [Campylobacterota bacterium]